MNRREFLRGVGTGGAIAAVAGCTGSAREPEQPTRSDATATPSTTAVVVADYGHERTDDGTAVTVSLHNEGESEETVLVEVAVTADDETDSQTDAVTIPAGERDSVRFQFGLDLAGADFLAVDPSVRPG